jgi:hypothetical protein
MLWTGSKWTAISTALDLASIGVKTSTGNYVVSGGGTAWTGIGYDYIVSTVAYGIQGVPLTAPQTAISLTAADVTYDRIDLVVANGSGAIAVVTGAPAASPVAPYLDPSTQVQLAFIYVPAVSTVPTSSVVSIYLDNVEWNSTKSGTGFNLASTSSPYEGTVDIEATGVVANDFVNLQKPTGTVDLSIYNSLIFQIKSKATWASAKSLSIFWKNSSGAAVGNTITFKSTKYGFNSATTSAYQQIVIPIADFNLNGIPVNQLQFKVSGSGSAIGFYIDKVLLQSGISQTVQQAGMIFKHLYSTSLSYNVNDVVYTGSDTTLVLYIALQSSVGISPSTNASYWLSLTQSKDDTLTWIGM